MTPVFYLDTNVILDDAKNRRIASIKWVQKIKENNWGCFTSVLGFMEMIDYEQEDAFVAEKRKERIEYSTICRSRNQMDLTKEQLEEVGDDFRLVRGRYPFIQSVSLTEDGWNLALHIAEKSNIFAPDAIHLAAAWQCKSNILLTADDHFKKYGNIVLEDNGLDKELRIYNPGNAENALADMGFEV